MADKVLFIPGFGASPRGAEGMPAIRACLDDIRAHFDVTVFHWPTVRGGPDAQPTWQDAAQVIARKLPAGGHVVAIQGNITFALIATGRSPSHLRSLVCDGLDVSPATWAALGMHTLAGTTTAAHAIINSNRYQLGMPRFVGADEDVARALINQIYADTDWPYTAEFAARLIRSICWS